VKALTKWWPVTATATFRAISGGIDLSIWLQHCRVSYSYPVRIYDTAQCTAIDASSKTWEGDRGELPKIACVGTNGAHVYYSRSGTDSKPWTLGGPPTSDLVGRSIAVLDPDTLEPLICGTIDVGDGGAPEAGPKPSVAVVDALAGLCPLVAALTAAPQPGAPQGCPDVQKLGDCAWTHCASTCASTCSDYVSCLSGSTIPCSPDCQPSQACTRCVSDATGCTLGFCADQLSCAPPPTPGGPCTTLRQCCMRQGPVTDTCLALADQAERLSGDPSCRGALNDWDFNSHVAYRSPCYTDAGAPSP
jgi:hypothetical protein